MDESLSWEERYRQLEEHHRQETGWLWARAKPGTIIIVTGARDGVPPERVERALDAIQPRPALIVQGGATGVDWAARRWAKRYNIPCATHEAHWKDFGKRAGPLRNAQMLRGHPTACVYAFPGPDSVGTWDCVRQAKDLGMPVEVVED